MFKRRLLVAAALVGILAAGIVPNAGAAEQSQFFTSCKAGQVAQVDPIVSPGQTSAHMHQFFGNTTTNANSTYDSMVAGGTTCTALADTAGYWVPTLISPSGQTIKPLTIKVYYRGRIGKVAQAFPPDLRMVTHTSHLASAEGDNFIIEFPPCWDGVHTDSPDHISHMAFEVRKTCPADHPVLLPRITIVLRFGQTIAGNSLSSDMGAPALSTMHADFWNTWQQSGLQALVDRCVNGGINCGRITG